MSKMTVNSDNQLEITNTSPSSTITLSTKHKYLDKDIKINTSIANATITHAGGGLTPTAGNASLTANNGDSASSSNTSLSLLDTTPSSGVYYTLSANASGHKVDQAAVTETRTAGYTTATTNSTVISASSSSPSTNGVTKYIPKASVSSTVSFTQPSVKVGGSTNMNTTSTGTYYFTRTADVTSQTVTPKHSVSTGYTPALTNINGTSATITPTTSGTGTIYIPTAQGSVTMIAGSGSLTGSNCTFSTSDTSGVLIKGKGSVSATAKITTAGYTPTNTSFASGSSTSSSEDSKYLTGVTLNTGKYLDVTNDITETCRIKYNSDTSSIDFIF